MQPSASGRTNQKRLARQIDLILCDVRQIAAQSRLMADTVVMNPPFGTRRKGADLEFLDAAFKLSRNAIYSLHKVCENSRLVRGLHGDPSTSC